MAEVVLFHHVQGLTDGVLAFAAELRAGGHTVHTPDLFDGERAATIEDGIALADAGLRGEFAAKYPEAWSRIEQRRAFMQDVIGIRLKPEVLPFSNIPAYLPPFILSPRKAMVARG